MRLLALMLLGPCLTCFSYGTRLPNAISGWFTRELPTLLGESSPTEKTPEPTIANVSTDWSRLVAIPHRDASVKASYNITLPPGTYELLITSTADNQLLIQREPHVDQQPLSRLVPIRIPRPPQHIGTVTISSCGKGRLHANLAPKQQRFQLPWHSGETIWANALTHTDTASVYLDERLPHTEDLAHLATAITNTLSSDTVTCMQQLLGGDIPQCTIKPKIVLTPFLEQQNLAEQTPFWACVNPNDHSASTIYCNPIAQPGDLLEAVLIHELAHLVCLKLLRQQQADMPAHDFGDVWLHEGLAHLMESKFVPRSPNLAHRRATFLNAPGKYPLTERTSPRQQVWRNTGGRGAAYEFCRWLEQTRGPSLWPKLIQQGSFSTQAVEQMTKQSFTDLHFHWAISLANQGHLKPDTVLDQDLLLKAPRNTMRLVQVDLDVRTTVLVQSRNQNHKTRIGIRSKP